MNHDLTKPALLLPILGSGGLQGPRATANLSATLGFAWTLARDARTVLRAGAGRYFDPASSSNSIDLINERAALSPVGTSRFIESGSNIDWNGVPLNFRTPTAFTAEQLLSILPAIRADLLRKIHPLGIYTGTNGTGAGSGFNNNDWVENDGPLPTDRRHIANLSGLLALPAGFVASFLQHRQPDRVRAKYCNAETFGQPGARVSHVFLSGGPRTVQFGVRVTF